MENLEILRKKWIVELIKTIKDNPDISFTEIKQKIDKISNKSLSVRLKLLTKLGFVKRILHSDRTVTYFLTAKGKKLSKTILSLSKL